jgi:SAM-dependent methyltransferase
MSAIGIELPARPLERRYNPSRMERSLLVCSVRPSRRRARRLASAEVLAVLEPFGAQPSVGGPQADQPGVFWVEIDPTDDHLVSQRAERLGYVDQLHRVEQRPAGRSRAGRAATWRGKPYQLEPIWADSAEQHRESAPDRRQFFLRNEQGEVREARGYRGSSRPGERRALPVADARLLVNLARGDAHRVLLDPFAGAGGIVFEAARLQAEVWSVDIDPALEPGLTSFGAKHHVASAGTLPFADASVDGVATEAPFDDESTPVVASALREIERVLVPGGRAAIMVGTQQQAPIEAAARGAGLAQDLAEPVDRKGTDVAVLLLRKAGP